MNYTVGETATKLNVSKQAIYNKIKLDEFKNLITKKRGKTYIDENLLNLIKDDLMLNVNYKEKSQMNNETATDTIELDSLKYNSTLIDALLNQLKVKDLQIQEKDLHIRELDSIVNQEQELNKNNQILLKNKPQQDIFLLKEHFQELDQKLEEVKNKMSDRKEQNEKKSLFSKIFK